MSKVLTGAPPAGPVASLSGGRLGIFALPLPTNVLTPSRTARSLVSRMNPLPRLLGLGLLVVLVALAAV
ncbi:MAG TPA: hypothetical protein VG710_08650, partial [Opitutus sp.]|nr:hypothetical protein [Opitutus sp.]